MTDFARLEDGAARPPHEWLAGLRFEERATAERPFLFMNFVASADGRATIEGRAQALGSDADTLLLTELRTIADAVLIGSGTLRAEGYARLVGAPERVGRRVAARRPPTPQAVLMSHGLDLPWDAGLFAATDQQVLIYTAAAAEPPEVAAELEVVRLPQLAPAAVLHDLRGRGVRALLCEGGPRLFRSLLAAGVVDELFLTISPLLTGNPAAPRIVEGTDLGAPVRLALEWVLRHDEELYLRYRVGHD